MNMHDEFTRMAAQERLEAAPVTHVAPRVLRSIRQRRALRRRTLGFFAVASTIAAAAMLMAALWLPRDDSNTDEPSFDTEAYVFAELDLDPS